jgi:hypothetical protein
VEYSLFIAVLMVGDVGEVGEATGGVVLMSERLEKRQGATLAAFPPPMFAGTAVFHVYLPPPRGNAAGGLYIVVSRSS